MQHGGQPQRKPGSLFSHSAGILFVRIFVTISTLFVIAYLSHNLPVAETGQYLNFYIRFTLLSLIGCAGINMVIFAYPIETIKMLWQRTGRWSRFGYLSFLMALFAILFYLHFRDSMGNIPPFYAMAFLVLFLSNVINISLEAIMIIGKRIQPLIVINFFFAASYVLVHLYVLSIGFNLQQIIELLAGVFAVKSVCCLYFVRRIFIKTDITSAPVIHHRRIRRYWISVAAFDLTQIVFRYLDKFLVSLVVAASLSAIYINGTLDIPFIPLIFAAVGNGMLLELNKERTNRRQPLAMRLNESSRLMATIVIPVFLFFFVFRAQFIELIFSEKYLDSVPVFAISIFKLFTYLFTVPYLLQYKQKGMLLNIGAVIDMTITLLLLFPLSKAFGLQGVVLSFVAGSLSQVVYYALASAKILKTPVTEILPWKNWAVKAAVFAIVAWGIESIVSGLASNFNQLLSGFVIMALATLIWLYFEFYREASQQIKLNK